MQASTLEQEKISRPRRRWLLITGITAAVALQAAETWQIYRLKKDLADLRWTVAVQEHDNDNTITPSVGTIQFLKRGGYSIQLEAAQYTGDGLHLEGYVGNPTNLWLSNLSLNFVVTKNLYEYRGDFDADQLSFIFGPQPIGEAQCTPIPTLGPGGRQRFQVTIPNIKQTKEGIRIAVSFAGERYAYAQ